MGGHGAPREARVGGRLCVGRPREALHLHVSFWAHSDASDRKRSSDWGKPDGVSLTVITESHRELRRCIGLRPFLSLAVDGGLLLGRTCPQGSSNVTVETSHLQLPQLRKQVLFPAEGVRARDLSPGLRCTWARLRGSPAGRHDELSRPTWELRG